MIDQLNEQFQILCHRLNKGSWNYQVDLELFPSFGSAGKNAQTIVNKGLDRQAAIRNCYSIDHEEALKEIENGIDYRGSESSRPNWKYLDSNEFKVTKEGIMKELKDLLSSASQVIGFGLKSGHPFYPVFWDFSYIIEKDSDAFLLIGSSSD